MTMLWADLDRVSVVGGAPGGTTAKVVIKDGRSVTAIAETRHLSILMAIAHVARGRMVVADELGGNGRVVYLVSCEPPAFLIEAVCAAGAIVFDGKREHVLAKPPEVTMLLDAAFCDLAIAARRRVKVRTFSESLDVLEYEVRRNPPVRADAVAWFTTMFELIATVGEMIRADRPGRWVIELGHRVPLALDLGKGVRVIPSSLTETVVSGGAGSLRRLVALPHQALAEKGDVDVVEGAGLMPLLHDRRKLPSEDVMWELLVSDEVDTPDVPVIAYVEDGDDAIRWPRRAPISSAMRDRTFANLGAQTCEIQTVEVPTANITLAIVTGSFYSAETILHRPTMKKIEAKLGSVLLLVGVPARGHMVATSSVLSDDALQAFLLLVEKRYLESLERDQISSEVIVYHGKPLGRVQSNLMDARRALRRVGIDPDA